MFRVFCKAAAIVIIINRAWDALRYKQFDGGTYIRMYVHTHTYSRMNRNVIKKVSELHQVSFCPIRQLESLTAAERTSTTALLTELTP